MIGCFRSSAPGEINGFFQRCENPISNGGNLKMDIVIFILMLFGQETTPILD